MYAHFGGVLFQGNFKTLVENIIVRDQGCIFRLSCSHRELTKDHVLTSVYVKIFTTVTRNAVNKSV